MKSNDHCIKICNSLLRGELSAVETYSQAIDKNHDAPVVGELTRIRSEHVDAAARLTRNVREMGGEPDQSSGMWGSVTNAVQGVAGLFGDESAVASLQRGEEIGRRGYEDALQDNDVMPECKAMIRDELLPRTISHIATLERLEQKV